MGARLLTLAPPLLVRLADAAASLARPLRSLRLPGPIPPAGCKGRAANPPPAPSAAVGLAGAPPLPGLPHHLALLPEVQDTGPAGRPPAALDAEQAKEQARGNRQPLPGLLFCRLGAGIGVGVARRGEARRGGEPLLLPRFRPPVPSLGPPLFPGLALTVGNAERVNWFLPSLNGAVFLPSVFGPLAAAAFRAFLFSQS